MSTDPTTRDALVEQLSAYVDGELDAATSRQVEERLATDSAARYELQRLQRAWDMLDDLPRNTVDPDFTATTVGMVAIAVAEELQAGSSTTFGAPWRRWLLAGCGFVAVAAVGFLTVAALRPSPNELLLGALPVIEHLDVYRQADSVEFLRLLRTRGLFADSSTNAPPTNTAPTNFTPTTEPRVERRARIASLTPEAKEQLLVHLERYQQLSTTQREGLQTLAVALEQASDADELRALMLRYHAWLLKLPAVQRAELLAMPAAERVERIAELLRHERRELTKRLSDGDAQVLADALEQWLKDAPPGERQRALFKLMALRWSGGFDPNRGDAGRGVGFDGGRQSMLPDLMQFQSKLSPAARALLTAAPPQQKAELFGSWTRQAIGVLADRAAAASGQPLTEARLRQFFEKEVPESERERLLSLPADEVRGQLQRMYYLRSLAPPGTNNPPDGNAPRGPRTGTGPNKRFDNERRPGAIPPPAS